MPILDVNVLGKFSVRRNGQAIDGLDAGKVQELFCYLLLHRQAAHSREVLASLLWCDSTTAHSKKYLRQALWQLQTVLNGPHASREGDRVLLVGPDRLQLNPQADLWLDVAVFEQAFSVIQRVVGQGLDNEEAQTIQHAVQLYKSDLLEGWYQDWCLYERERYRNMYFAMLDKLMDHYESHRQYENGLACGVRSLQCDRARERTHRQVMRLYYLAGDRTAALRQYRRCVEALEEELGVRPERRTIMVYEQIRGDQIESATQSTAEARTALPVTNNSLVKVLDLVNQLQDLLVEIQQQTQLTFRSTN